MPRTSKGTPPSYPRNPHVSGQARITVRLSDGRRRDITLGRFGSPESHSAYLRVLSELSANNGFYPLDSSGSPKIGLLITQLVERFRSHAQGYYRLTTGEISREVEHFDAAFKPLLELYGAVLASDFGPLRLKAVRQRMIENRNLCRRVINQRIDHIRRLFRWAVSEQLVPCSAYESLRTVAGLRRGHQGTFDHARVKPVPDKVSEAILPHVAPQVAALVQLQRLTGARPTEVCMLRGRDIESSGPVWWYRIDPNEGNGEHSSPGHKTAHHVDSDGSAAVKLLPIGPKAQAILKPWLRENPEEFLFQPKEARETLYAKRRAARGSPLTPSQRVRKPKNHPKRQPGTHYTRHSYARAVARGCELAGVPHFHPHQLKHSIATEVRRKHGAEASRVYVGHKNLKMTEIYAEADLAEIERIAQELG